MSERLAQCVVEAIGTGSSEGIEERLEKLGFTGDESALIALAVRTTRPELKTPARPLELAEEAPGQWEQKVLDI